MSWYSAPWIFPSVIVRNMMRTGNYIRDYPDGYDLYQSLSVTSVDIDKVENISRDITKLIESGWNLYPIHLNITVPNWMR